MWLQKRRVEQHKIKKQNRASYTNWIQIASGISTVTTDPKNNFFRGKEEYLLLEDHGPISFQRSSST